MVHLLSQLDPMVWLMMVVVAIGFVVSAVVLVELLPGAGRREAEAAVEPIVDIVPAESSETRPPGGASP
ncbi:MAG TPA: hypothetical protein VL117_11410 [Thermoleophilia bacterium]|nr:hypothetical protein [Thermoleophilia bacterium]